MRCDEAQMLIGAGYWLTDMRPFEEDHSAADEIASHIDVCLACRESTLPIIWRNFRRRPTPCALLQALYLSRNLKRLPLLPEENGALQRLLNTFLQIALAEGVHEIIIEACERDDYQYPRFKPLKMRPAEESQSSYAQAMREALDEYDKDVEIEARLLFRKAGEWQEFRRIPPYVHPGLCARTKSRAYLTVSQTDRLQEGTLPFQYEGSDYNVHVRSEPHPLGESIYLTIAHAGRMAA